MPKYRVVFVKSDSYQCVKEIEAANLEIARHDAMGLAEKGDELEGNWEELPSGGVVVTEVGVAPEPIIIDAITDEEGNVIEETDEEKRARVEEQEKVRAEQAQAVADAEAAQSQEAVTEEIETPEVEEEEESSGRKRRR